jgi:hypothetical protein
MKVTISIITLMIVISISAFGQPSDKKSDKNSKPKEQVAALTEEFAKALIKGDTATLERILAPEYGSILPGSFPESKKILIEYFKVNANTKRASMLREIDFTVPAGLVGSEPGAEKFNIRLYDNSAVVFLIAKVKWLGANDQILEQSYLATLVAIKKDGRWQFVIGNASEVPKGQISKPPPN